MEGKNGVFADNEETQFQNQNNVSKYEQSREERIKENLQRMKKLGLFDLSLKLKPHKTRKTPQRISPSSPPQPTRRSSRLLNASPVSFSTILTTSCDDELIIPKSFVDKTGIAGKTSIGLYDKKGKEWKMNLRRNREGEFVMCGEWAAFQEANRLSKGYVCSFELFGSYGDEWLKFCLEKRSRGRPSSTNSGLRGKTRGDSRNPDLDQSFAIVLSASADDEMIIPKGFAEKIGIAGRTEMMLLDEKGVKWEMNIVHNRGGEFVMVGEWAAFRKTNGLSKGCVCSFEVVRSYGDQPQFNFHLEKRSRGRPSGA